MRRACSLFGLSPEFISITRSHTPMKSIISRNRIVLAVAAIAVFLTALFAQGKKHGFTLRNQTGVEIQLYLSPHSSDDWEEDVLGREALPDGENVQVNFD